MREALAELNEDLGEAGVILAVKEVPISLLLPARAYVFFAHVIKGQDYNMPLLRELLERKITLVDYERIMDDQGRRLVFFGRQAGQAGMIETLHGLGKRLAWQGLQTPLTKIRQAYEYEDLADAKRAIGALAGEVAEGMPAALSPLVVGFAGYGNVSQGAQEVFDLLPHEEIAPGELADFVASGRGRADRLYKVVFKEEDMAVPKEAGSAFELQDYYKHPERYRGIFDRHLPYLTGLVNCIYWTEEYPRLITKAQARGLQEAGAPLRLVGDISCDIDGSVEFTHKATQPDEPSFVYDAVSDTFTDGVEGEGIAVMAVDNLPCELPRDASEQFSDALRVFLPALARADYSASYEKLALPDEIKRAMYIV